MKNLASRFKAALWALVLFGAVAAHAADVKTYQVTGPVLAVTPASITVQKGDEKWEIARNKNTKMKGEPKVGAKVTIYYTMVAAEVEIKDTKEKK